MARGRKPKGKEKEGELSPREKAIRDINRKAAQAQENEVIGKPNGREQVDQRGRPAMRSLRSPVCCKGSRASTGVANETGESEE